MLQPGTRGPTSLPSGLGAGGRGKEKAPCRYLHYEVDWDGSDGDAARSSSTTIKEAARQKRHRLEIGRGPSGEGMKTVCLLLCSFCSADLQSYPLNGSIVTCGALIIQF